MGLVCDDVEHKRTMQDDVDDVGRCRTMEKGLWCVRDTGQPGYRITETSDRRASVTDVGRKHRPRPPYSIPLINAPTM